MDVDLTSVVKVSLVSVEVRGTLIEVQREMTLSDGSVVSGKHVFPSDTLEWRAAEYGIDPKDLDTLLDIVIHEPFINEPEQAVALLYDAPSIEDARDRHLARINEVKSRAPRASGFSAKGKEVEPEPDPVRDQIKALSVMNPEAIEIKREFVEKQRTEIQAAKEDETKQGLRALFVEPNGPEKARIDRLRASLMVGRPTVTYKEDSNG